MIEIKILQASTESMDFKKLNPDLLCPVDFYKLTLATIDFKRIVGFYPNVFYEGVTNVDTIGGENFWVPMQYEKFKEFYNLKMAKELTI